MTYFAIVNNEIEYEGYDSEEQAEIACKEYNQEFWSRCQFSVIERDYPSNF